MSEIEVPIEQASEHIHHEALHSRENWIGKVALSSAIFAVLAAVAALNAGHHANEAMLAQIRASDHWNFFQAKGIKSAILQTKIALMSEAGRNANYLAEKKHEDEQKFEDYKKEQEEISQEAKAEEKESKIQLNKHETLAKSVTFFQVSIAVSAISVLVRRRRFWHLSLVFGGVGIAFFGLGLI